MLDKNKLGQHIHRSFNATTIRKALVLRFVGLIAFSFLVLTVALYFFVVVPVARETASDELARAAEKVETRVESVVNQTEQVAWTVRDWARNSEITLDNFQSFGLLMAPILHRSAVMSSALFADNTGRELMLLHMQKGNWRIRITDREKWGNRQKVLLWRDDGRVLSEEWIENDYDPRKRPWHAGAMELVSDEAVYWTDPYIFFTTKDPGITTSVRLSKSPMGGTPGAGL